MLYNCSSEILIFHQVPYPSDGQYRFCVVTVTGEGLSKNQDFYVRGKFSALNPGVGPAIGPFGGIAFNMEGADTGNYVMMR